MKRRDSCVQCRVLLVAAIAKWRDDGLFKRLQAHRAQCRSWQRYARYAAWFADNNRLAQLPPTDAWTELDVQEALDETP